MGIDSSLDRGWDYDSDCELFLETRSCRCFGSAADGGTDMARMMEDDDDDERGEGGGGAGRGTVVNPRAVVPSVRRWSE
ncbi:hypothetical protein CP532_5006 [Ophiocordyceps camponoti-leonardi (nom. inval.)]|nr:hypothetical protein CP532_5006 [Ophiocordyceps camponoti-leonardi (nom. inval.)]